MKKPAPNLDMRFAAAALRYGRRHEGLTNPNPCVAALVVKQIDGTAQIVGRGITGINGRPHAEAQALRQAGADAFGSTLYVTLEPCSHYGLTPPCTDAILASGIAKVVACTADPDPRVSGTGFTQLRNAGVELLTPILDADARRFHAGHIAAKTLCRPHVFLKMAISANGLIGTINKGQIAITGAEAWNYVHGLRGASDTILVGSGTIVSDDPSLTCRLPGLEHRSPQRIVMGARSRIPTEAKILADQSIASTQILEKQSCKQVLKDLWEQGTRTLMIEGGASVASAFLEEGLVDACHILRSSAKIDDRGGVLAPLDMMTDPGIFELIDQRQLGSDHLKLYWRKD